MKKLFNMQAWCDEKHLISYNTSVAQIISNGDYKYMLVRDYDSRTTRRQLCVWLREVADLNPTEHYLVREELAYTRQNYRKQKRGMVDSYIIIRLQHPEAGDRALPYSWTLAESFDNKDEFINCQLYHEALQVGTPTI